MDALFQAVDVTGVSTNVSTLLIAFIGINLLFLGAYYVKKTMNRGLLVVLCGFDFLAIKPTQNEKKEKNSMLVQGGLQSGHGGFLDTACHLRS